MNLYLFRKYWSKHKGRLFSLILSIILLSASFVFSVLNERSEIRRKLHAFYNVNGNFDMAAMNVDEEQIRRINEIEIVAETGKVSVMGKTEIFGEEYTIGYYGDEKAPVLNHLPLIKGGFPQSTGEVAIPQFLLEQIDPEANIGDEIELKIVSDDQTVVKQLKLSGVLDNNIVRSSTMEFTGLDSGYSITPNNAAYPLPSIYMYRGDFSAPPLYTDLLIAYPDEVYFDPKVDIMSVSRELFDICPDCTGGSKKLVTMLMVDDNFTFEDVAVAAESDDLPAIRLVSYMIMLAAIVSMITGIVSILPERIESLKLLRSIGMSKRDLVFLFVTEFFMFWMIGTAVGTGIACGLHEITFLFRRSIGMLAYRGYTAEYIVNESTMSPFVMPIILSFLIAAVSLTVPVYKILTMSFYKRARSKKSKRCASSLRSAYSKISVSRSLPVMTCVLTVIVIFTTAFGYCFYTKSDKGTSYLTGTNTDSEDAYYFVHGIDLRKTGYICSAYASQPKGNELAVHAKKYGIDQASLDKIRERSDAAAWGTYPTFCVLYNENTPIPENLDPHIVRYNEEWEYYEQFKSNTILDIQLILLNDKMMDEIGGFTADDVVCISGNLNIPYEIGDTVPLFTCLSRDAESIDPDTMKFMETKITGTVSALDFDTEGHELLNYIGIPAGTPQCFIAMTAGKAEETGFYYPSYSRVLMKPYELTDTKLKAYVRSELDTSVQIVTMSELERSAKLQKLSANANYIVLFIILFVLNIISTWNILRMNVSNNMENFSVIHSLGMPIKKLRKIFVSAVMKYSVISVLIGSVTALSGQCFIKAMFQKYMTLLGQYSEMIGNKDFPEVPSYYNLIRTMPDDPNYTIVKKMTDMENRFMLKKELWLPKLLPLLTVIAVIILFFAFLTALSVSRKIKDERSNNDDRC